MSFFVFSNVAVRTFLLLFFGLLGFGLSVFAQDKQLDTLNQIEGIKSATLPSGREVVLMKFNRQPLFELVPNLENNVLTVKIYEAKSLLQTTSQLFNLPIFRSYLIKKISEEEFWVLLYLNNKQVSFRTVSERIDEGYLGFEFTPKADDNEPANITSRLVDAKFDRVKNQEYLYLFFDNLPEFEVKQIELPHFLVELTLKGTSVKLTKEIENYSYDIIKPVKFFEADGSARVVIEPFAFGLNVEVTPNPAGNSLVIAYSNAPLSAQIQPQELQRFQQDVESNLSEAEKQVMIQRRQRFSNAELLYRDGDFRAAMIAFDAVYREEPQSELGLQALFRRADSKYSRDKNSTDFFTGKDTIDMFISAINSALEANYKGPELYRAYSSIAEIYEKFGYFEEALNYYQVITKDKEIGPYKALADYQTGIIYQNKGDYKKSLDTFLQFIKDNPNSGYFVPALYKIGDAYFKLKDYKNADIYFSRAETLDARLPDTSPELLYDMAEVYLANGRAEKARSLYEKLIDRYPNSPFINFIAIRLGDYLRDNDQSDSAIQVYGSVITKEPVEIALTARMRIANIFSEDVSGDYYQKAIDFYDFLVDRFPQTIYAEEAKFRTGITLGFQKKYSLAIEELELFKEAYESSYYVKSNEVDNQIVDIINSAIEMRLYEENPILGVQFYNEKLDYVVPVHPRFDFLMAVLSAEKTGLMKNSTDILLGALEEKNAPNQDLLLYKIIGNQLRLQNYGEAFTFMNQLIEGFPESVYRPLTIKLKADTLNAQNKIDLAGPLYHTIIDEYSGNPNPILFDTVNESIYELGNINAEIGRFSDALAYYEQTVNDFKYPLNDERVPDYMKNAIYRIGEMNYENDELEEAKIAFDKAIALYPDYERMPWARYFIGQIYLRRKLPEEALKIYRELVNQPVTGLPQLWQSLAREALLEAEEKAQYIRYLKNQKAS